MFVMRHGWTLDQELRRRRQQPPVYASSAGDGSHTSTSPNLREFVKEQQSEDIVGNAVAEEQLSKVELKVRLVLNGN